MSSFSNFFNEDSNPIRVSFEINPRSKYLEPKHIVLSDVLKKDKLVRGYVSLLSYLEEYVPDVDDPMPPRKIREEMHNCIDSLYLPQAYKRSWGVKYLSRKNILTKSELEILDRMLKAIFKEPTEQYMNYMYDLSKSELVDIKSKGRRICKYLRYSPKYFQKRIEKNLIDDSCYNFDFELLTWVSAIMMPFCYNSVFNFSSSEYEENFEDLLIELNYELIDRSFKYLFETAGRRVALKLSIFDEFNLDTETLLGGNFEAWETLVADRKHFLNLVKDISS